MTTGSAQRSLAYPWYVVGALMLAYIVSFVDRQIMALLIEPIRADLHLNDTQFGLLHGLAFALFYALLGIPIARLFDRRSRPLIIAIGVLFWSFATAACGLARNFWHLLAARIGVGAGEATLSPATYSILADYFPKDKLGRAAAAYSVGSFIGAGLAFLLGGTVIAAVSSVPSVDLPLLGGVRPWQVAFMIVGLPGALVALLIWCTVKDPLRREIGAAHRAGEISGLWCFLVANRGVFTSHYFGYSMSAMALFSLLGWSPAFLIRRFGLLPQETGYVLGIVVTVACTAGVLASGWLMDMLRGRGYIDSPMRTGVIGAAGLLMPIGLIDRKSVV